MSGCHGPSAGPFPSRPAIPAGDRPAYAPGEGHSLGMLMGGTQQAVAA